MRRNKGQSPIQVATIILVIIALVGSWMAYSSAGPASTKELAKKKDVNKLKDRIDTLEKRIKALKKGQSSIMKKIKKWKVTKRAKITVQSIDIPSKVKPGEEATIRTIVKNVGEKKGSKTIELKVAGKVRDRREVTLKPGEVTKIGLKATMEEAGSYGIRVGTQLGTISVGKKVKKKVPPASEIEGLPIKIGSVCARTGGLSRMGLPTGLGYDMAVKYVNEQGGVLGKFKVQYTAVDDESSADTAVTKVRRLITAKNIDLLLGTYSSGVAVPVSGVCEKNNVVFTDSGAVSSKIYQQDYNYTFQFPPTAPEFGTGQAALVKNLVETGKIEKDLSEVKVGIIHEDGPYGTTVGNNGEKIMKNMGMNVLFNEPYPFDAASFSGIVTKIKTQEPDVLVWTGYNPDIVKIYEQMKSAGVSGLEAIIGGGAGFGYHSMLKDTGGLMKYTMNVDFANFATVKEDVLSEEVLKAKEWLQQNYPTERAELSAHTSNAFGTTWVVLKKVIPKAIRKYKSVEPDALRKVLEEIEIKPGESPEVFPVRFNDMGKNVGARTYGMQWLPSDGYDSQYTYETIWPAGLATADAHTLPDENPFS